MLIRPGIEVKAIEGFALDADRNQRHPGPNLFVEAVLVHAEIARRIAESQEARCAGCARGYHWTPADRVTFLAGRRLRRSQDLRRRVLTHDT
jgi:hypothetical protein